MSEENFDNVDTYWDDVKVGNFRLNHSELFFAKKQGEIETVSSAERIKTTNKENNQNAPNVNDNEMVAIDLTGRFKQITLQSNPDQKVYKPVDNNKETQNHQAQRPQTRSQTRARTTTAEPKLPTKVATFLPNGIGKMATNLPDNNKLFADARKIAEKKLQREMQLEAQAKAARSFKPRPVPDFKKLHDHAARKAEEKKSEKLPTCPTTPNVLKSSQEAKERNAKKFDDFIRQQKLRPFVAGSNGVVNKSPFKPKLDSQPTELAPFNLHVMTRLQQRKLYDENTRKCLEKKMQQKEEQQRIKDMQLQKEIRKCTEFKANRNPFSS